MSGIVNAHTHLYSGLAPLGMPAPTPEPENFVQILERVWWRLDRALDEASLRASAELYIAEARGFGTPALVDHHESPNFIEGSLDVIAGVCDELDMPAVLTYGATERNGGRDEARRGLQECRRFIEDNRSKRLRGLVGLHAAFTCSDQTLRDASDLARELKTGLHVHVAEDAADVADAQERGYQGVVERLDQCGCLVPGSIFVHGVHLTRLEVARLVDNGIWLVQNPRSNKGNGVGYPSALSVSPNVALGTDGYPADMETERAALAEAAGENGEDVSVAAERADAGRRLFRQITGLSPEAPTPLEADRLEAIRENARQQADALWQRMRAL